MTDRRYQGSGLTTILVLIVINFVLYLVTAVLPEALSLQFILSMGLQPATFLTQPWTIVTNLFIHGSFWHFFANMLTFYFFGSYLIQLVGENRFLTVYFGGGILGNIFFLLLGPSSSIAVGASGAIFALGGALAMLRPKLRVFVLPIPVALPLWGAIIGGFFIISLAASYLNINIAWQAHLGGLVLGLAIGYFFRKRARQFS